MNKNQSAALVLFEHLPAKMRRELGMTELKGIVGAVLIKDRIQQHFHDAAMRDSALRKYKRQHGYCGGLITCLTITGDRHTCSRCLKYGQRWRDGETRKNGRSAYGEIRAKERSLDKAERHRLLGIGR